MKKNNIRFIYQILILIVCLVGLITNFIIFDNWTGVLYYTILSNIFVFVIYFISIIFTIKKKDIRCSKYYKLKGLMLLSILCTMVIYNVALDANNSIYSGHEFSCNIVHLVVPLLALFECLFFEDKKVLKYKYLLYWTATLIAYFIGIVIYSLWGGTFLQNKTVPYEFLNITNNGLLKCTLSCIIILLFYLILGAIIIFIDNKMKEKK